MLIFYLLYGAAAARRELYRSAEADASWKTAFGKLFDPGARL